MPGKGTSGGNSLPPACQCKSYRVKAQRPEAQFGGVSARTAALGELESRVGRSGDLHARFLEPAFPSHPQSRGLNERTGHLNTTQLNHAETQDRLSWCSDQVQTPVW